MASKAPALLWPDLLAGGKREHYRLVDAPWPSLVELLCSQAAQEGLIREFVADLRSRPETDHEIELICSKLIATVESPVPLPLELTWYVHFTRHAFEP